MKKLICFLNGLTDVSLDDLGGKTPFEKAHHPFLDSLTKQGAMKNVAVPSHSVYGASFERSFLSLLGIEEKSGECSRGPLEAYSIGYSLSPQQAAFSVRFVAAGQGVVVDVTDQLLSDNECKLFCKDLNREFGKEGLHFLPLQGSRAVLLTTHPALHSGANEVSLSPSEVVGKPWWELQPTKEARGLLERFSAFLAAHEINALRTELEEQPVNAIWLSEGGKKPSWADGRSSFLQEKRIILHTTSPAIRGIAKCLKIPLWQLPEERQKFDQLLFMLGQLDEIFDEYDVAMIELLQLWDSTYKGDLLEKIKTIEWLDRNWLAPLYEWSQARKASLSLLPLANSDIRKGKVIGGSVPLWRLPKEAPFPQTLPQVMNC